MLNTSGVITLYSIWFVLAFCLAAVILKINSK
jgi:hypothetical protein